ncbi:hypothetical protein STEG23_035267 [Scotinomys teguina]
MLYMQQQGCYHHRSCLKLSPFLLTPGNAIISLHMDEIDPEVKYFSFTAGGNKVGSCFSLSLSIPILDCHNMWCCCGIPSDFYCATQTCLLIILILRMLINLNTKVKALEKPVKRNYKEIQTQTENPVKRNYKGIETQTENLVKRNYKEIQTQTEEFKEPLNIVTDSQYAERVVLHIETAEFIPDESELTSLFIQLQDIIRNRKHPLYITHIQSLMGLPGPLAQGNDEIDKLLIGNVLEASEFHKKHHVNSKGLKRDFCITWQQAKDIVKKCPTCSFYNQTPLPAGCNRKGTQRNEIWQMDVFHFAEFGKLKYVHHTIDTYSGFQWATALSSEKADSVIMHLLEVMATMGISAQIKTDNAPAYVSGDAADPGILGSQILFCFQCSHWWLKLTFQEDFVHIGPCLAWAFNVGR